MDDKQDIAIGGSWKGISLSRQTLLFPWGWQDSGIQLSLLTTGADESIPYHVDIFGLAMCDIGLAQQTKILLQ